MAWNKDEIVRLLVESGEVARRVQEDMSFELKADRSIVTPADQEIERLLGSALERPEEGVYLIGEETVETKGEEYLSEAFQKEAFVVDPIDGTAPFAHGLPNWGISIGRMVAGRLTDGAVYLPAFGELLITSGEAVLAGTLRSGQWRWEELHRIREALPAYALIAITQELAKRGRVTLPNPVMVLGAAVVPLLGILQGRFVGYVGSVKLWDIAGCLPLLLRKGLAISVVHGGERREVTDLVEERTYDLGPGAPKRWALKSDLVVCARDYEERFRAGFTGAPWLEAAP